MADSLIFDGTDDKIIVGGLPASLGSGAMTILAIVKADVWNSYAAMCNFNAADGGLQVNNNSPENLVAGIMTANYGVSQFGFTETGWLLVGYCKAAGSVAAQFHKYVYATNVWTHSGPTGGNVSDDLPAATALRIGESAAFPGSGFWDGNMLIMGIWNSKLTDLQVEALNLSKQAWIAAAPAVGIRFDSASAISGGVFAGTATQTSRTGTTLDVGDVPTGPAGTWTDGAAGAPAQKIRPTADYDATGWTPTPLWSRIDEAVADDADFITSTAS